MQHTSLYESSTVLCPANKKHLNLQLPRDSSVAVPQIQRLIPKGWDHTMNRLNYTPVTIHFAWLLWIPTVLLNFKNFSWGCMLLDPKTLCTMHKQTTVCYTCPTTSHSLCMPPFFISRSAPVSRFLPRMMEREPGIFDHVPPVT